ncbi:MAG: hypothetical protein H6987_01955 [Pseudomonadales bacterium]|nr:hypothetical protein [Halioglobus sp.]MCP5191810.1 hypothetical protein [Pseudomonadales bacterium]
MPLHGRHRHVRPHLDSAVALLFAAGSTLFMLGGILSLVPALAAQLALSPAGVNAVYFAGSVPFTTAAGLQLAQAASAQAAQREANGGWKVPWLGWYPGDIGWLGCALQFAGTVLFNLNTFDAMLPDTDRLQQDLAVWAPDMIGSGLFLSSGFLAFIDCSRGHGPWQPRQLSWWVVVVNLLGCLAFMLSAVLSYVPTAGAVSSWVAVATGFTTAGAAAFLLGSLLMLPAPAAANPV